MRTSLFAFYLFVLCLPVPAYGENHSGTERTGRAVAETLPCDTFSEKILPYLEGCYSAARKCEKEFPGATTGHVLSQCVKLWCYQIKSERLATKCEDTLSLHRSSPGAEQDKNPSFLAVHKKSALRAGGMPDYKLEVSDCP